MVMELNIINNWHNQKSSEVLAKFNVTRSTGHLHSDIKKLQDIYGLNKLPQATKRSFFSIFIHQFLSPLIYLLIAASIFSFIIGDHKDAVVILVVVVLNAIIGSIQEGRAEQSLASLRKLSELKVRVLRDGKEKEILASELVPGDIFMVAAGDSVGTDARLIEASSLVAAEAALTGESIPVSKTIEIVNKDAVLADRSNMIYAGTFITAGRGVAVAVTTGTQNEIGRIAELATTTVQPKTQLELRVHQFGKYVVVVAIVIFFAVVGIGLLRNIVFAEILMIAISQMVSLVPEGLPVALTVALAVGVQRMAKRKTVVRRLSAVETLGSISVICTDKTGTLTKNEMTVVSILLANGFQEIEVTGVGYGQEGQFVDKVSQSIITHEEIKANQSLLTFIEATVCCNDSDLLENNSIVGDPTEVALLVMAKKAGLNLSAIRSSSPRCAELPFDSNIKMMATEHEINGDSVIYIKGAPEAILSLCGSISDEDRKHIQSKAREMADAALRILAVGMIPHSKINESEGFTPFAGKVSFLGLLAELDPPREEVKNSVRECLEAGIRPVMVTGDHKATAFAIAASLGIAKNKDEAMDGHELDQLSEEEFLSKVEKINVFARVHPAQKLKIVAALQKKGHVVAMTGDGVNDAPALVQANVGVAMGITGTEVAKGAAKIVIADDNFATIVSAISEGRLVYQNIKKLILFLFVTSIDEVIVLFLALIAGYPPPLAAVQILWLNLVGEGTLTVNLIMEPHEGDEMNRRPVPMEEPLLDRGMMKRIPLMAIASVISTFGWFIWRTSKGIPTEIVQTETFTVLVVSQWFNVLNCRSSTRSAFSLDVFKNKWLVGGLVLANVMHLLVIYWRPLGDFFHTVPIALDSFFEIGAVASLVLWVEEARKFFVRSRK